MKINFKTFLWALKLGAPLNLALLALTFAAPLASVDAHLLLPARILLAVNAFRCLFPVSYQDNIVLHDSPLSSIFLTRLLATFSEVALIYQLATLLRLLNTSRLGWIDLLAGGMLGVVLVSQVFVWGQVLTGRLALFFYEELGWLLIYAANTFASVYIYITVDISGGRLLLLQLNLLFGALYLPWQVIHLRFLRANARQRLLEDGPTETVSRGLLMKGLQRALHLRNQSSEASAWGGWVGALWMTAYWATLMPLWVFLIERGMA